MIPPILHRTVPTDTTDEVEGWWAHWCDLHPTWDHRTWRDPIDPAAFPLTADVWPACTSGAQRAGLVRLEALWHQGGIYIDSDVEGYRSLEPLRHLPAFAAWEDIRTIPDAVLGAEPHHPAIGLCIERAIDTIDRGAWESGPGVTTAVLADRDDVLILPPAAFYPYHWSRKARDRRKAWSGQPFTFAAHHWHASWLP